MTRVGVVLLACLALPPLAVTWATVSARTQDPEFEVVRVRDDVHLLRGAGGNSTVLTTPAGKLVVDTKSAASGPALRRAVDALGQPDAPVRYVVYSHHHAENTGGAEAFHTDAVCHIAQDATHDRMAEVDGRGADLRFQTRATLALGEETATLHHKGAGHTAGDVIVHFARARVLVVGGLAARAVHPALDTTEDGGDLRRWMRILQELIRDFGDDAGLVVVPGDGEPGGIEVLQAQLDYFRVVLDYMEAAQRNGQSMAEALREAQSLRAQFTHYAGDHFEALLRTAYVTAGR